MRRILDRSGRPKGALARDALSKETAEAVREVLRKSIRATDLADATGLTLPQIHAALNQKRVLRAKRAVELLLAICK